jgi:hypothetical protein
MTSIRVDPSEMEWGSAGAFYGPGAVHEGRDIVHMSDRRGEGGGIAYLGAIHPAARKIDQDRRDGHVRQARVHARRRARDKIGPAGKRQGRLQAQHRGPAHSAMIAEESTSLIAYTGEPDAVHSPELVDLDPAPRRRPGSSLQPAVQRRNVSRPSPGWRPLSKET